MAQLEAEDWRRVGGSSSPDELENFVRRHPGSAHANDARTRAAQLRQQSQQAAARQPEQTAWDSTNKASKAGLQDFLLRYGNGTHAEDARTRIAEIEKREAEAATAAATARQQAELNEHKKTADQNAKRTCKSCSRSPAMESSYRALSRNFSSPKFLKWSSK